MMIFQTLLEDPSRLLWQYPTMADLPKDLWTKSSLFTYLNISNSKKYELPISFVAIDRNANHD